MCYQDSTITSQNSDPQSSQSSSEFSLQSFYGTNADHNEQVLPCKSQGFKLSSSPEPLRAAKQQNWFGKEKRKENTDDSDNMSN